MDEFSHIHPNLLAAFEYSSPFFTRHYPGQQTSKHLTLAQKGRRCHALETPSPRADPQLVQSATGASRRRRTPHASLYHSFPRLLHAQTLNFTVQAQAGAQAIEEAAALGVLFSRLPTSPTPEQLFATIATRLGAVESVRKDRTSIMQIYSNAAQDQVDQTRERARRFLKDDMRVPGEFGFFLYFGGA